MEEKLIDEAINRLSEIIGAENVQRKAVQNSAFDFSLKLYKTTFLGLIKQNVTTSNFGAVQRELKRLRAEAHKPILLFAGSIYPQLMKELRNEGVHVLDGAGNCAIHVGELLLYVEGKKKALNPLIRQTTKGRLFKEAGLKVIFRLLLDPEWVHLSYRKMANSAAVSVGSISILMRELKEAGFILETSKGLFLKKKKELLEHFIVGYHDVLKPKLLIRRMTFRNDSIRGNWMDLSLEQDACWGGESAAFLYDGYLNPEVFMLYGGDLKHWLRAGLLPDEKGEVWLYTKFWTGTREGTKVAPHLLIYADLMGSGNSRNIEAAQRIYDYELQHLK